MQPFFRITANDEDITRLVADRLIDLRVRDEAGFTSDTITLTLDDRDHRLVIPPHGAKLQVWIGYRETGLTHMGLFLVDEVSLKGWPAEMSITAKATDMLEDLKTTQTRAWHATTLGTIAATIAAKHGLAAAVDPELASFPYAHLDQTGESDMALLTRLSRDHDAVFKITNGTLILKTRANGTSTSGIPLDPIEIKVTDLTSYSASFEERSAYNTVRAAWTDHSAARRQWVSVGTGKPVHDLRYLYASEQEARSAATAHYNSLARERAKLSLSMPGKPTLGAERKIRTSGLRDGLNQDWIITSAEHSLSGQNGLTTSLNCKTPTLATQKP